MVDISTEEEISYINLYKTLKKLIYVYIRYWKLLFTILIIGFFIGYLISLKIDPTYTSAVKFVVNDKKPRSLNNTFVNSLGFDLNLIEDLRIYESTYFIDLLKSRKIIQKTLLKTTTYKNSKLTFFDLFIKDNKVNNSNKILFIDNDRNTLTRKKDSLLSNVSNNIIENLLSVELCNSNKNIFIAEMKSKDEFFSVNFLNSIFDVVLDDYKKMKLNNIDILNQRIDTLKNETIKLLKINTNQSFKNIDLFNNKIDENSLEIDLNIRILKELSEQLEISKINLINSSQLIQVIDNTIPPLPNERINKIYLIIISGLLIHFLSFVIILLCPIFKKIFS